MNCYTVSYFYYINFYFQEAIEAMRKADVLKDIKKTEVRKKSFGVLDRFLLKP